MNSAIYVAPLRLQEGKKLYTLNYNRIQSAHFIVKGKLKETYEALIRRQCLPSQRFKQVNLTLVLYPKDKRRRDRANVLCLHEKFCCDALVKAGVLADDSDDYVLSTTYFTGSIDKNDPRVEIHVTEA